MRVVMTLLVRDEEDIIEANIEHHFAQGVDFVIATDNGSVDGTISILERYERSGRLRLIHEPTDDYSQHAWVTRMACLAARDHGADWVINNDADEFWFPTVDSDLRTALASIPTEYGSVPARRFNHVPRPVDGRPFWERMTIRNTRSVNEVGKALGPKLAHRGDPEVIVRQGNHEVESETLGGPCDDGRIEILHFPLRTYAQFENKVICGGAAHERNTELPAGVGVRWRNWYALWRDGGLPGEWASFEFSDEAVAAGLASGELVEDRRVVEAIVVAGHESLD